MSYPGVEPADVQTMEPVGTQATSVGVPPTPNPLLAQAAVDMHEKALRGPEFVTEAATPVDPAQVHQVVQQAVTDMFALQPVWQQKKEAVEFVIHLPSGQTVLAKHLSTMDLVEAGLIDDIDFFSKKLLPKLDPAGNPVDEDESAPLWSLMKEVDKRKRFLSLLNKLIDISILKPKVIDDGLEIATRDDGTQFLIAGAEMKPEDYQRVYGKPLPALTENSTYASAVDFGDKMAIFGELNKPLAVIEPFRGESSNGTNGLEHSESNGSEAK